MTCFLSCHPIQTNFSLRYAIESPSDSFCEIPWGKYFQFPRTVPVRVLPLDNNGSASGTAVYQLSVYK